MADLTAATLARIPEAIDAIPAVVETASPLTVTIDGATHAALSWMGVWQHAATDRVLVIRSRGRVVIVGSLATRPTSAIVGSTGSGRATVTDDGGRTISGLPYVGTAPGNGTRVGIVWGQDGGYISGVLSATVGGAPGTDVPGIVLSTLGLLGVVFALIEGQRYGWILTTAPLQVFGFTWASGPSPALVSGLIGISSLVLLAFGAGAVARRRPRQDVG